MSTDKRKIIHDIPLEELLKIATDSKEEIVVDKLTEAAKFIYDVGIKHGDVKISAQMIYYTYKQWKGWNQKKQPKIPFFHDFSKYFTAVRDTNGMNYLLDPKPFDLSKDNYWRMRAEIRHERSRKKTTKQS